MEIKYLPVSEVMTVDVITVNKNDTADIAYRIMQHHNIHHLPVLDDDKKLCGIVSKTDLDSISIGMGLFANQHRDEQNAIHLSTFRITEFMVSEVVTLNIEDTIETAIRIFSQNKIRAIPIMNDTNLVGILSALDILKLISNG